MENFVFIAAMLLMTVFYIYIILRNFRSSKDRTEYYFYGRRLKTGFLTLTIVATQIGGGMVLGITDEAYARGFMALLYPLGSLVGLCIVAFGLSNTLKAANLSTISEIFEKRYHFPTAKKISSIISSASLFFITVAQGVAIKNLLNVLGISQYSLFVPIWLSVVAYASLGGLKAVVQTDILQIIFIACALCITTIFSLATLDLPDNLLTIQDISLGPVINWFIWPCCYMLIEQDMVQRFIAADSGKTIRKAALLSAIGIILLAFMPVLIGVLARSQMPNIAQSKGILLLFAKNYLSPSLYMFIFIASILAILSTVDSVLCAISNNIACDFRLPSSCFGQKLISLDVIITAAIGILSLIAVYYCERILSILMFSYGLCVSVLFVPLISGLILKNPQRPAALLSMVSGFISFMIFSITWKDFSYISILCSAGGYLIASIFNNIIKNKNTVAE